MLRLDQSLEIEGLSLYRDSRDETTFHFLPAPPRAGGDAGSGIELLKYRGAVSGGLLTATVDLRVGEELLEAVREALADRFDLEPNLVPILFDEGTARLTVLDARSGDGADTPSRWVEEVLGSSTPSLLGDQRAIFAARLTPEGTTLAEAALDGSGAPLTAIYELTFSGLRPSRGLRVEVDYAMAYEHLRARLAVRSLWFRADLDREAESLRRAGHIRIVDVDYDGSDPVILAQRQTEARRTVRELMETLFARPAASPAAIPATTLQGNSRLREGWRTAGGGRGAFVLRALRQEERQTLVYEYDVTRVARSRVAPQGAVGVDAAATNDWLAEVRFDEPPTEVGVRAYTLGDSDWTGVSAVTVDYRSGEELRSVTLDPATPEASVVLPAGTLERRLRAHVDPGDADLGEAPDPGEAFAPLEAENLFVEPHRVAGHRTLRLALGGLHGFEATRFEGRLAVGEGSLALLLSPDDPLREVVLWGDEDATLDGTLVLSDGRTETVGRTVTGDESLVRLSPSLSASRRLRAVFNDPLERFLHVDVEIEEMGGDRRWSFALSSADDGRAIDLAADARVRYRSHAVLRNAQLIDDDWRETDSAVLVFGDFGLRASTIDVVLLPTPGLMAAQLLLTPLAPPAGLSGEAEAFVEPGAPHPLKISFEQEAEPRYTVSGQLFFETGEVELIEPYDTDDEVLVLG